jgi:hypothetical protein
VNPLRPLLILLVAAASLAQTPPIPTVGLEREARERATLEARFYHEFLSLSPEERVRLWLDAWRHGKQWEDWVRRYGNDIHMWLEPAVQAKADVVPALAEVVKGRENKMVRSRALASVCQLARSVPAGEAPVQVGTPDVNIPSEGIAWRVNPYLPLDERVVGKAGLAVIRWATQETSSADLRLHAKEMCGLLESEFRPLSLQEKLERWKGAVEKSRGMFGFYSHPDEMLEYRTLGRLIAEQAPESLPPLVRMMDEDRKGHVATAALDILQLVDGCRLRLRATAEGQMAIAAVRRAAAANRLYPYIPAAEHRASEIDRVLRVVLNDEGPRRLRVFYYAFEQLHGEKIAALHSPQPNALANDPGVSRFAAYLTKVDPYYPSWEYSNCAEAYLPAGEVFQPGFRRKAARLHAEWTKFRAIRE